MSAELEQNFSPNFEDEPVTVNVIRSEGADKFVKDFMASVDDKKEDVRMRKIAEYIGTLIATPKILGVIASERLSYAGFEFTYVINSFNYSDLHYYEEEFSERETDFCFDLAKKNIPLFLMVASCQGNFDTYIDKRLEKERLRRQGVIPPGDQENPFGGESINRDVQTSAIFKFVD